MKKLFSRWILIIILLVSAHTMHAQIVPADTSFLFFFEVNMTKAIQEGVFDPDSCQVSVEFEEAIPDLLLIEGPDNRYSALLLQELDSGVTYHFRFRINDTIYESIDREATANQGITEIREWWNNDYMNTTTFRIDASGIPFYWFTFGMDEIQIEGEMNQWQAESLHPIGTSKVFEITFHLDPTRYYQYIFRIKTDTNVRYESFGGKNRLLLPPDTVIVLTQYFNNQDTGKIALTVQCHMNIMQQTGVFNPDSDFVDIAGNFNNWGAWDLLYDNYQTGLYTQTLLFDKSMIGIDTLAFKFRINGSWEQAELQGENPREWILQPMDTTWNPNSIDVWYNNIGPVVPGPPWVSDVFIQGLLEVKQILSGAYLYHNLSGIPEGASQYQWYRADSLNGIPTPIDSATGINYTTDSIADMGKYLVFEVTPVAAYGDSATGQPVRVYTTGKIGQVGIPEFAQQVIRLYPNPASVVMVCEAREPVDRIELLTMKGRVIASQVIPGERRMEIPVSALVPGIYILRVWSNGFLPAYQRFIKL